MNKRDFVELHYNDFKKACSMFYNRCCGYIDFEDYLNDTIYLFLKSQKEDLEFKNPFSIICNTAKNSAINEIQYYNSQKRKPKFKLVEIDKNYIDFDENYELPYNEDFTEYESNEFNEYILRLLSNREKEIMNLLYKGYTQKEISIKIDRTLQYVSSTISKARKKIKAML